MVFARAFYIFLLALVLACLEVQIEGGDGWAANLPTWRPCGESWYVKIYQKVFSGKEMTGYHLAMFSFVALIFHLPFFWGVKWSWPAEIDVWSIFFLFIVIWDYLWFVVNPHFSLKKFSGEHIFWHQKWWGSWPQDYWLAVGVSFVLAAANAIFFWSGYFVQWLITFFIFCGATFAVKIFIKVFKPDWE